MTDRENALLIMLELERSGKAANLPFLCIIGLPDEQGFVRASNGLLGPDRHEQRMAFCEATGDYMLKLANTTTPT